MAKKNKKIFDISTRFAMAQDAAERLVSSSVHYSENDEGWYTSRKEDGEIDYRNNVTIHDDGIAVVHIDGTLGYRAISEGWWGPFGDYYDGIQAALDDLDGNPNVLGVVLDINSPGGVVNGCSDLSEKIYKLRGRWPFGIVARTGGLMQSGAYWLASACEKIYASDSGIVGSIGTLARFSRDVEKKYITIVSSYSPNKAPDPESGEGAKIIRAELDALAKVFINAVARNRGYSPEDVEKNFGNGANFVGAQAVDAGLIDAVKSFEDMCAEMKNSSASNTITNNEVVLMNKDNTAAQAAAANPKAAPVLSEAELKAQGVQEYKARASAVKGIFAGLPVDETKIQEYIDGEQSIDALNGVALGIAKEQLAKASAPANAETTKPSVENGLTPEQVAAVKDGLEAQASAQNGVHGGASAQGNENKDLLAFCADVSDKFYKKGRV